MFCSCSLRSRVAFRLPADRFLDALRTKAHASGWRKLNFDPPQDCPRFRSRFFLLIAFFLFLAASLTVFFASTLSFFQVLELVAQKRPSHVGAANKYEAAALEGIFGFPHFLMLGTSMRAKPLYHQIMLEPSLLCPQFLCGQRPESRNG